ncbi:MAG: hypothetical protein MUQ30_15435 [Anaerolineae bacterium]|nr:hypothetical protein [Anaerolineae bacterium]
MTQFPRTSIGGLSVPRMIIGTNWFMGWSHTSKAQDNFIKGLQTREKIADVVEVFFNAGINAILGGGPDAARFTEGLAEAEQRTGVASIWMGTPTLNLDGTQAASDENMRTLDAYRAAGCRICMPHQATTDALLDRRTRTIRDIEPILAAIREREMIPGLSTHMPEAPIYADETGIDVETYIQIYNAAGFLMQIEVDWVHRSIWRRQKPVITIKPIAAGRVHPLVGLAFNWATIRDQDMVCVGCMTPDEAREDIEISLSLLEHRAADVELQSTRSKASVTE